MLRGASRTHSDHVKLLQHYGVKMLGCFSNQEVTRDARPPRVGEQRPGPFAWRASQPPRYIQGEPLPVRLVVAGTFQNVALAPA